eukprot:TRINITY_DN62886_c0_g1_i1.p1 TRINITY_DN62886_c0_g1~~TRINITY_DN62886_c0_g1_i1.p1  ORF type:complete len:686 (-),score=106.81 TRINITY_DN62886_c0_g1_i1:373-2430(-)
MAGVIIGCCANYCSSIRKTTVRRALLVFLSMPCYWGVPIEDVLITKVWLDQHLFNMTLKTTKVPSGHKLWMMNEEKAKENGLDWPPHAWPTCCFVGLGENSLDFLVALASFFPELQLVLLDVEDQRWLQELYTHLGSEMTKRVEIGNVEDFAESQGAARRTCQAISWSVDTPPFSFYRYRELFYSSPYVLALFNMQGCTTETRTDRTDSYYCEFLYSSFQNTLCGRLSENKSADYHGKELYFPTIDTGCGMNLCLCHAYSDAFLDFHFDHLCRKGEPMHKFVGQWGQDRFLVKNVFRKDKKKGRGLYVDVGASHPYLLSNTAYFDLCLGWQGVCVEPNPRSRPVLRSMRTCEVVTACAWANTTTVRFGNDAELAAMTTDESLNSSDPYETQSGEPSRTYFEATCQTLHDILVASVPMEHVERGLPVVIDVLSVDAEGAEIEIFRGFPFEAWDIRSIVVETSRRTSMAIDGLLLTRGFIKIAVLGKDAVYVSHAQAKLLPEDGLRLPESIQWNEPGSDSDFIDYMRFQRFFGIDGDLDVDVGDQRLQNETELERQSERLEEKNKEALADVERASQGAILGGFMSEKQRERLEDDRVKDILRDAKVKQALAILVGEGDDEETLGSFLQEVNASARLKTKIVDLIRLGLVVHKGASKALGVWPEDEETLVNATPEAAAEGGIDDASAA